MTDEINRHYENIIGCKLIHIKKLITKKEGKRSFFRAVADF